MAINLGNISLNYAQLMFDTVANDPALPNDGISQPVSRSDLATALEKIRNQFELPSNLPVNGHMSIPKFMRLGRALIDLTQREDLGLWMGEHTHPGYLDIVGYTAMVASDLIEAHRVIARFEPILSFNQRGQSKFILDDNFAIAEFYSIKPYNEYNRFVVDFVLSSLFNLTNWIAGKRILPLRIEIEFDQPEYLDAYKRYFSCPIQFSSDRNALVYQTQDLKCESRFGNRISYQSSLELANLKLKQSKLHISEYDQLKQILSPMIHGKTPSIEEFANTMGTPVWTLRRQLKKQKTHYKQLLDEVKHELAMNYVRDTNMSIGEIAWQLGFSNPTGFQRAFVRWTGQPPGAYRLSSRQNR